MPSSWTNAAVTALANGGLDLDTNTLKVILLRNTYTNNQDHGAISDIVAHECTATNYVGGFGGAGRKTLSTPTVTRDDANNRVVFDAVDPATWTALGGATNNALRYVAVVRETTSDALSIVIALLDFGADLTTNGGDVSVAFNATGIGTITT